MFSTTLRIPDELAAFLQEAARRQALSVNAYLTYILEARRGEERRQRLAQDWAAYAAEPDLQAIEFATAAQAELVAEKVLPYGAGPARKKRGGKP